MNDLTIILPTHKRHNYLETMIKYYAECGYDVHICDSSSNEFKNRNLMPSNIYYHWMPKNGFYEKVLTILSEVSSKLVILTPDDDFLNLQTLKECKDKMLSDENISLSVGLQVFFNEPYDGKWFILSEANRLKGKNLMQDKLNNARVFGQNYQNVLWSLYRHDVIFEAFSKLKKNNPKNANFIEMTLACEATVKGRIYVSPNCLNYRENLLQSSHWGAEVPEISNKNLKKDFCLQKEMETHINQYDGEERKFVIEWVTSYLNASHKMFINRAIRKTLRMLGFTKMYINPNLEVDKLLKEKGNKYV